MAYLPSSPDRETLHVPYVATRGAVCRRMGASDLSRRDAVLVHALPRRDRRVLPREASRDDNIPRWLVLAGAMGGLSVAIKITGPLVRLRRRPLARRTGARPGAQPREYGESPISTRSGYRVVAVAVPVVFLAVVGSVLASNLSSAEVVNFLLPVAAVCAVALWSGIRPGIARRPSAHASLAPPDTCSRFSSASRAHWRCS